MKCPWCKVEMVKTKEMARPVKLEIWEYYADRHTCPKCGHYERDNFQYGKQPKEEK